ncbi:hypothetical protein ES703_69250 [subsurface metagenome]
MKKQAGFTLIELMVVVAILGILGATSVGFLTKYRQRTVGSEATVMMKQLLEAQIIYFLAHDEFFPKAGDLDIVITHNGAGTSAIDQPRVLNALKVSIPIGHLLDFHIKRDPLDPTGSPVLVKIASAASANFDLFPGSKSITGSVDKTGKTNIWTP